jgi:hypothetical protein
MMGVAIGEKTVALLPYYSAQVEAKNMDYQPKRRFRAVQFNIESLFVGQSIGNEPLCVN